MNELNDSSNDDDHLFTDTNNNSNSNHIKLLYQELADKEQALVLAAQFGKNLIDEKEDLEKQIESMKREQQNQIETLEQESYELKRLIESMRNEYEAKIYELNEDLHLLNRKLLHQEQAKSNSQQQNEQYELIQDLNEKNQKLIDDFKSIELKYSVEQQNTQQLEKKLADKENQLNENSSLLNNFRNEINQLMSKRQELDYALMQTCNERDKQSKLIDELTEKYLILKTEKNDLEHLIYQHENELFTLRRANQELLFKYEKLESLGITAVNRKRRSTNSSLKKAIYNSNFDHFYNSNFNSNSSNKKLNYSANTTTNSTNNNNINNSNNSSSQFTNTAFLFEKPNLEQHNPNGYPDIEEDHELDLFKMNEIEQDDEDEDVYFSHQFNSGAVNWEQESIEHSLNLNCLATKLKSDHQVSDDDYVEEDDDEEDENSNHHKTDREELPEEASLLSKNI